MRAYVRACVRACMSACVRVRVYARVPVCVCACSSRTTMVLRIDLLIGFLHAKLSMPLQSNGDL